MPDAHTQEVRPFPAKPVWIGPDSGTQRNAFVLFRREFEWDASERLDLNLFADTR